MIERVVVVGAGVIGLACAWRIAQRTAADVTILDPRPGSGASAVAAGMLAPLTEAHPAEEGLLRLALVAAERYPEFAAELASIAVDPGYASHGTLAVAFDADDRAELDRLAGQLSRLGLQAESLDARACRRLEPGLAPEVRGGLRVDGDRSVDNRQLVQALLAAAERAGVRWRGSRVERVVEADGRVSGVRLDGGAVAAADVVVVAAGCWSGSLHPSIDGLIRPVKGEILRLRPRAGVVPVSRTVRGTVQGQRVYLVPRADGEIVVGATQQEAGFDTTVTAGAVYALLRDARRIVPGIDEYSLAEASAGLRPGSRDNVPLIGALGPAGLIAATGHHRNGMLLAGVTADAVATLLVDGALPSYAAAADPARFVGAPS